MRRRLPWVQPGESGTTHPATKTEFSQYGFNVPKDIPLFAAGYDLSGADNAVVSTFYEGAGGPVDWDNMRIHGKVGANVKWGVRAFDVWGWKVRNSEFADIKVEHGIYGNTLGGIRVEECAFENIGAQAGQFVYALPGSVRAHETGIKDPSIWYRLINSTVQNEWQQFLRCTFQQVTLPNKSDRASFTLSFFEPDVKGGILGHSARVQGCYFKTSDPWVDPNGVTRDCGGAIMAHSRSTVEILGNYIEYLHGNKSVIQLWGCPSIVIKNNVIKADQDIDIRLSSPRDHVRIERNVGDSIVRVWDNQAEWYAWPPKHGKLLYEGPISQPWSLNY